MVYGADAALGLPALYAGCKILADGAACLPLRVRVKNGTSTQLYTGPTLFDDPSELGTSYDWMFSAMMSAILHGNAWGLITGKDGYGYPTGIEWIPPDQVYVQEAEDGRNVNPYAAKVFAYGREMQWRGPDKEVFHVKAMAMPGRLEGISLLRAAAITILGGEEAHKFGTSWYQAGGFPTGIFRNTEMEVDKRQAAQIRGNLLDTLRRREPLVYGRDWEYTPVTVPPSEAQFIDAMQWNATEIAAMLNLPPDRIGGKRSDSLTYNTVEMSALQIVDALRPWLVRFERAFSRILPGQREARFDTDALLKVDLATRTNMYNTQRRFGFRTVNELRELDDLPPLPGKFGDDVLPLDLTVALGQRAGAIPKNLAPEVDFLMDHAAILLAGLQEKGLAQVPPVDPMTGDPVPSAEGPQQMLSNLISTFSRNYPGLALDDRVVALRELSDRLVGARDPELRAGWARSVRDRVLALDEGRTST